MIKNYFVYNHIKSNTEFTRKLFSQIKIFLQDLADQAKKTGDQIKKTEDLEKVSKFQPYKN